MGQNGGKRPGAGRKRGSKSQKTIEKERVLAALRNRIMANADRILNAQLSIAQGQQFLYRIVTTKDEKGRSMRGKPELITSEIIIEAYLNGDYEGDPDEYYFITTKEPSNQAIDSMFNRAFGKPTESHELTGKDGAPLYLPSEILTKNNLGGSQPGANGDRS